MAPLGHFILPFLNNWMPQSYFVVLTHFHIVFWNLLFDILNNFKPNIWTTCRSSQRVCSKLQKQVTLLFMLAIPIYKTSIPSRFCFNQSCYIMNVLNIIYSILSLNIWHSSIMKRMHNFTSNGVYYCFLTSTLNLKFSLAKSLESLK
jgi:hypothetical protein